MQGERRVVTVLFCDVTGSTSMAEQLDPEEWAEIMDDAFDFLIAPVYRYEGVVSRLMGDAILAFFGAPVAHEDDPQRAILAGLDIISGIQPFIQQIQNQYNMDFNVRVGINTGEVVVGEIGSDLQMEYTAMGDAVNLAARMEQTAQPGTVQVAENTYKLVAPLFDFEELGSIPVKGKAEPVPAYRVLGLKSHPGRLRGIAGLEAPMIGREREIAILDRVLGDLRQGRGSIVSLIGEAGLGKSRLIEELFKQCQTGDAEPVTWFETRGVSYDTNRPYGLFQQHFRHFHGVSEDDSLEVVLKKVAIMMQGQDPELSSLFNHTVELLLMTRVETIESPTQGEAFKRKLFDAIHKLLFETASRVPLVMVFDDLHWADPASADLLLHLFQLVDQVPILFLCAFRPYRPSPGWQIKQAAEANYPHRYTEIRLSPLNDEQGGILIEKLLSISNLPASMRELILRKAEGNPFFVEEVIRALIDHGAIRRDESGLRWEAVKQVESIEIPDSLQALLIARIDRLEEESRRILQLAAVIGRSFYYRVLQAISDAHAELDRQLNNLQRVELIRELTRHPELEYMFRHELTRDAAYQSILHRRRRQFHLQVAEAIESLYPERLEEEAHRLAYHFREARDYERALKYTRIAGDAAARLYANTEAEGHFRRAIELARRGGAPLEQLAYLYTRRGRILEILGQYDEALANYQELEKLGREQDRPELELAALLPQATIFSIPTSKLNPKKGLALTERGYLLACQLEDHRAEAKALWTRMLLEFYGYRNSQQAVSFGEQALAIARQHNLREELAYTLHDITRVYLEIGRQTDAWAAMTESQELWRELGNLPLLADSLVTLAQGLYLMGAFQQAIQTAQEGLSINQKVGSLWGQAFALNTLGPLYLECGNIEQGIQSLEESLSLANQANFIAPQISSRMLLAWVHSMLGDVAYENTLSQRFMDNSDILTNYAPFFLIWKARMRLQAGDPSGAYAIILELGDEFVENENILYYVPMLAYLASEIILADHHYDDALTLAERTIARMHASEVRLFLPDLLLLKGKAFLGMGRAEEAHQAFYDAREEAVAQNSRRSLWPILSTLVEFETGQGNLAEAESFLLEARQTIEYIAGQIARPDLRTSFLDLPDVRQILYPAPQSGPTSGA